MNTRLRLAVLGFVLAGLVTAALRAQVPQLLNYQGRVASGGVNFNGTGQFKFALVDSTGANTYWSNDGTSSGGSEPVSAVPLTVTNGLYSVLLGNTALPNMTTLPSSVFAANSSVYLRVWFDDGTNGSQLLAPDQQIAAVAYAMVAGSLANGAIGSSQLAPNLTLGGTTTISGDLNLPVTTSANVGVLNIGGVPFLHAYGPDGLADGNTFVGEATGNFTMSGIADTAVGYQAFSSDTTGLANTANGYQALYSNSAGSYNTASGAFALYANSTGSNNTASGFNALYANTSGTGNTASGVSALVSNNIGSDNTATGYQALNSNSSGSNNTAAGYAALYGNSTGTDNTASGYEAMFSNTTGSYNTASGYQALYTNSTGTENVAYGYGALYSNTVGGNNTASGLYTLFSNTTASQNVAIGSGALQTQSFGNNGNAWTSNNVAVGYRTLFTNQPTSTTNGSDNIAIGASALYSNTTGGNNTAGGYEALYNNTTGLGNTAAGSQALAFNTTGSSNIAIGSNAGRNLTTGSNNIDIFDPGVAGEGSTIRLGTKGTQTATFIAGISGVSTATSSSANAVAVVVDGNGQLGTNGELQSNTNGGGNTVCGYQALFANTSGAFNTAVGDGALSANTSGETNTAIGLGALQANTTGEDNIAIGSGAGENLTTGVNNIDIFDSGVAGESDTIRIGTQSIQTKTIIAGIRGVTTGINDAVAVLIDGDGQLGTASSSRRYKEDITDMGDASARLLGLRPVTFRYKKPYANGDKPIQFGLIAEEVAEVFPELTVYNAHGEPETVKYQDLGPLLLNEFLKDHRRLQEAETKHAAESSQKDAEIAKLREENAAIQRRLAELEAKDKEREARLSKLEQFIPSTVAKGN